MHSPEGVGLRRPPAFSNAHAPPMRFLVASSLPSSAFRSRRLHAFRRPRSLRSPFLEVARSRRLGFGSVVRQRHPLLRSARRSRHSNRSKRSDGANRSKFGEDRGCQEGFRKDRRQEATAKKTSAKKTSAKKTSRNVKRTSLRRRTGAAPSQATWRACARPKIRSRSEVPSRT